MMKKITFMSIFLLANLISYAQIDTIALLEKIIRENDSIDKTFTYQHGKIILGDDLATLNVPSGYKYLNPKQSEYVMTDLWGNPPGTSLGMLFPEDMSPLHENFTYAIEITYSEEGYIDDKDASKINYDDLLKEMQKDTEVDNETRVQEGYPSVQLIGWASTPFYDKQNKKLHWAKELKFEEDEENTLNYNIRILGRKGYINMNAIGQMSILPLFKKDIEPVIASVEFNKGNRYADFNPKIDEVAAYGIGGLIAGKILAKAGFFAVILKFWKIIALAVVGFFGAFKKKLFGSKEDKV